MNWSIAVHWCRLAIGTIRNARRSAFGRCRQLASGRPQPELAVWSGDIVRRDADGFLYFIGRRDELIKTSGYRVSPTEVEEEAYATGLVGDAVAIGVPHAAWDTASCS